MATDRISIGNRIAPVRFLAFAFLIIVGVPIGVSTLGWRVGTMAGFDVASIVFLLICIPLLNNHTDAMREAAKRNDANRGALLGISAIVVLVILVSVALELSQKDGPKTPVIGLIIVTLILAWMFSNVVYAVHYAHVFYTGDDHGKDRGGIEFPGTKEPDYWDFIYFSSCLGMTFQTSDVDITSGRIRRIVTGQCLAAFVFNIGVLAFTINVLGG
jgi:uncharacterized membrane protein